MFPTTSSTTPFADPTDVLAGVFDEQAHGPLLVLTGGRESDQPQKNVEEMQEVDAAESVISVTTHPLSVINDLEEQLSQAQKSTNTVSQVFHQNLDNANAILKSSDNILFYVSFAVLNEASSNAFGSALQGNVAHAFVVDESSAKLNIILHVVYDWPLDRSTFALRVFLDAVDRMPHYGLSVQQFIHPTTHIFTLMTSMTIQHPVEIYTMAAHHFLHAIAVIASSYLLSCDVRTLPDRTIVKMGVQYFKRLADLQLSRISALNNIVGTLPVFQHGECSGGGESIWVLAALYVMRDGKPDYSPDHMFSTMAVYAQQVQCARCQHTFMQAISDAVAQWAVVPATI